MRLVVQRGMRMAGNQAEAVVDVAVDEVSAEEDREARAAHEEVEAEAHDLCY